MNDEQITRLISQQIEEIEAAADFDLWDENPALAARLAFGKIQLAWIEQAEWGIYGGRIPNFDAMRPGNRTTDEDQLVTIEATAATQAA